jgi:hypothetical protein
VEPDWPVVARDVSHPVGGGGSSLCSQLHISLHLLDVLDNLRVRYDVTSRLVIEEIPCAWDATIALGKDRALVDSCNRAVLVILRACNGSVTLERHLLAEKGPVAGFIVGGVDDGAVPVNGMDKLAYALLGLSTLSFPESHSTDEWPSALQRLQTF